MRHGYAAGRADKQGREDGATAEAAQRHAVGQALAHQEQQQGPDGVGGAVGDQGPQGVLPGEENLGGTLPRALRVRDRQPGDDQAHHQGGQRWLALRIGFQGSSQPPDAGTDQNRGHPDDDGPPELPQGRRADVRQTRYNQGERAPSGPGVKPDEDERADARGQQAGHEHQTQHRPAQPGCLHQQERTEDGRPEKRADGGEGPGRGEDGTSLVGYIAPGGPQGQHDQSSAQRDEGRLRPQHGAEDQRGQGGQEHAGQLSRCRRAVHLEPIRRGSAAAAGQVLDGQPGQNPAYGQDRQRPPHRLGGKAQAVREMSEDFLLEVVDQLEEAVGGGGDRHPEGPRDDQQLQVAAAAQERARIRRHGHQPMVRRSRPPRITCRG